MTGNTAGPLKCLSQTARLHECMRARVSLGVSADTLSPFGLCYVLAVLERPTGLKYDSLAFIGKHFCTERGKYNFFKSAVTLRLAIYYILRRQCWIKENPLKLFSVASCACP